MRASQDSRAVERGQHLAMGFGCTDCHRKNLQGGLIPTMGVSARNLTRLAAAFSDADFDRAVHHGLRPDDTSVAEFMPWDAFQYMSTQDMDQYWFARQKPALDLGPSYARGLELAMSACGECHMTPLSGGPPEIPGLRPPDLSLVAAYGRADFLKLMHTPPFLQSPHPSRNFRRNGAIELPQTNHSCADARGIWVARTLLRSNRGTARAGP